MRGQCETRASVLWPVPGFFTRLSTSFGDQLIVMRDCILFVVPVASQVSCAEYVRVSRGISPCRSRPLWHPLAPAVH